ncbi:MAG: hypothetical protein K2X38_18965 [Gemmataceae bacterium]|nr:hypothetical protein [Gemmataceae bacterium]
MASIRLSLLILAFSSAAAHAQGARRVFVLHSGVHIYYADPDKDYASKVLSRELQDRGIAKDDIVIIPNPFPTASKEDRFPRDGLLMFLDSADPKSKFSQDAYRRFDKALADAKIPDDARLEWIGYSAGGQVGMTMSHLATHLDKYPELAKATKKRTIETVFAVGTPMGADVTPKSVKLYCYCSPADQVVQLACSFTPVLPLLGYRQAIHPAPLPPRDNTMVRWFEGIQHPDWIRVDRVFDRMLQDLDRRQPPPWRSVPSASPVMGLSQGICEVLADRWRISLEDPPEVSPKKGTAPR